MSLNFLFTKRLETSKYIINHSINIDKNIKSQDIDININYKFNLLKKNEYKSIFISLKSFKYLKLLSISFTSTETQSFDIIKILRFLIDFFDINQSLFIIIMNYFNSILPQLNQLDALYFDKMNIIDFFHH